MHGFGLRASHDGQVPGERLGTFRRWIALSRLAEAASGTDSETIDAGGKDDSDEGSGLQRAAGQLGSG